MGDDVIVFSDKHCLLTPKKSLETDWTRWFRSAIKAGAIQAWGAERWFREHPDRVFLDAACTRRIPVLPPHPDEASYHLVVTVHGVAEACRAMLGGTGSLELRGDVRGLDQHIEPFVIGDLDPKKTFVHVLDDVTMDVILRELDTATDFLNYIKKKEAFLRSRPVFVAGEENLLGFYLAKVDSEGAHAFVVEGVPAGGQVGIDDSWWPNFLRSPERKAKLAHDEVSYLWDGLIERFAEHALAGTQEFVTDSAFESSEKVLRVMAAEPRLRRRYLSQQLFDALRTTSSDQRRLRIPFTNSADEVMYVFLLFPWKNDLSHETNRLVRRNFLEASVLVAKLENPSARHIIGIATESGVGGATRSEDALYFDAEHWSDEDTREARELQERLNILTAHKTFHTHIEEYPLEGEELARRLPPNPRNKPCPCGSGKKYKQCHGRPVTTV